MKKTNKKGFTIVELVIVVAVIAILSAILIPTFSGLVKNAKEAALQENLRNAYTEYTADAAAKGNVVEAQHLAFKDGDTYYTYNAESKKFEVLDEMDYNENFLLPFFETSKYTICTGFDAFGEPDTEWLQKIMGLVYEEWDNGNWTYHLYYEFGSFSIYYRVETDAETGDSAVVTLTDEEIEEWLNDNENWTLELLTEKTINIKDADEYGEMFDYREWPDLHFKAYELVDNNE